MKLHLNTISRKKEVVHFGVQDSKGREIGAIITRASMEAVEAPENAAFYYDIKKITAPGPCMGFTVQAARDGESFGASQATRHFQEKAEGEAYIQKRLDSMRKRYGATGKAKEATTTTQQENKAMETIQQLEDKVEDLKLQLRKAEVEEATTERAEIMKVDKLRNLVNRLHRAEDKLGELELEAAVKEDDDRMEAQLSAIFNIPKELPQDAHQTIQHMFKPGVAFTAHWEGQKIITRIYHLGNVIVSRWVFRCGGWEEEAYNTEDSAGRMGLWVAMPPHADIDNPQEIEREQELQAAAEEGRQEAEAALPGPEELVEAVEALVEDLKVCGGCRQSFPLEELEPFQDGLGCSSCRQKEAEAQALQDAQSMDPELLILDRLLELVAEEELLAGHTISLAEMDNKGMAIYLDGHFTGRGIPLDPHPDHVQELFRDWLPDHATGMALQAVGAGTWPPADSPFNV